MNLKTLKVLEYFKILNLISLKAKTNAGIAKILEIRPYTNIYEARKHLLETDEAVDIMRKKGSPPFPGVVDTRDTISRLNKNFNLNIREILDIANLLKASRMLKEYIIPKNNERKYENLENIALQIIKLKQIEDEIFRVIISESEISDNASSTLYNIRSSLKSKHSSIKDKLESIIKSNAKYLQEVLYTIRGDRYVIPVKSEYKNQVQGLVHDQSSTGATFFIEPMSLIKINNEIKELNLQERDEIDRILRKISNDLFKYHGEIFLNSEILNELDLIFSKALYAEDINATLPIINDKGIIELLFARHPLIDMKKVVSSDIKIGNAYTSLVITGPNTGGKTVTLKTIGLIELMALSGILIPAESGSSVAFFEKIFADIGDEQSIEQNLSTFSSHMTNIVDIIKNSDQSSLILLDELGAGTDPEEGAALAETILENLRNKKATIVATTHYSELKAYALRQNGVENGSVEFSLETLSPTYRLLIGMPGKSNAFEISRRLGLTEDIIEESKKLIKDENKNFDKIIAELQEKKLVILKEEEEIRKNNIYIQKIKDSYEKKYNQIEKKSDDFLEKAKIEAKKILKEAEEKANETLKKIREAEMVGFDNTQRKLIESERKKLKDTRDSMIINKNSKIVGERPKEIKVGEDYYLEGIERMVTALSLPDKKGNLTVQSGIMKITANIENLIITNKKNKKEKSEKKEIKLNNTNVPNKIDIRGFDSEEAIYITEKFIDDAFINGLSSITIIHGKGTGILRESIKQILRKNENVKSSRFGEFNEGGNGATIVELK